MINTETLQQELENERQLNKIHDMNGDTNMYRELIMNNAEKVRNIVNTNGTEVNFKQHVNYIQYDRHPKKFRN